MSKKHTIAVSKTAAYYSLGEVKTAKTIWFVLHGYGYLAEHFIRKFQPILSENTCIIAPEALSKFYLKGFNGKIGASWMTKHQREEEINDYSNYLDTLYNFILQENKGNASKINIVGFSQGGPTACRWIALKKPNYNNLILWASVFPEDVNAKLYSDKGKITFVYGTEDEFLTKERIDEVKRQLCNVSQSITIIQFEGKHEIPESVLLNESIKNNWN